MSRESRIHNRVIAALEQVFDRTVNGDVVKDRDYVEKYQTTLRCCYVELEQYRKQLKEIKAEQRSLKGTSNRS